MAMLPSYDTRLDTPPQLLDTKNFICWKKRFEVFVKAKSYRLWKIIEVGPHISGDRDALTETQFCENNLATHLLYSALPDKEYKKIYRYDTAHDIWKALERIYEGKSDQLKENKIKLLTNEFDTFSMRPPETVDNMCERYIDIINSLKAIGKSYDNATYIDRILRALPHKLHNKVKVFWGSQKISLLSLEDVLGSLKTVY